MSNHFFENTFLYFGLFGFNFQLNILYIHGLVFVATNSLKSTDISTFCLSFVDG